MPWTVVNILLHDSVTHLIIFSLFHTTLESPAADGNDIFSTVNIHIISIITSASEAEGR